MIHPTASLKCWEEKNSTLCNAVWRELGTQPGHSDQGRQSAGAGGGAIAPQILKGGGGGGLTPPLRYIRL